MRLPCSLTVATALATALRPGPVFACATCALSAYGDRGFNWGYGALLAAPFLVMIVVAGVLGWSAGYRLHWRRAHRSRTAAPGPIPAHEETT